MPVQDHELFDKWDKAMTELKEAHETYWNALKHDTVNLQLARRDWEDAQKRYNKVADQIE